MVNGGSGVGLKQRITGLPKKEVSVFRSPYLGAHAT